MSTSNLPRNNRPADHHPKRGLCLLLWVVASERHWTLEPFGNHSIKARFNLNVWVIPDAWFGDKVSNYKWPVIPLRLPALTFSQSLSDPRVQNSLVQYCGTIGYSPCSNRLRKHMTDPASVRGIYLPNFPPARLQHPDVIFQRTLLSVEFPQHPVVSSEKLHSSILRVGKPHIKSR